MLSHPNRYRRRSGFTLLEMLLVLAIISFLAAMIIPSLSLPAKPPVPGIVAFLQKQQGLAAADGKTRYVFWVAPKIIVEPGDESFDFDKEISLNIDLPPQTGYLGKQLLAVFYGDGTGIASEFAVVQKKTGYPASILYKIEISPFHSQISYAFQ